ncbi:uncharacterized protein J8A68_005997 [[Candida] subhashii]|uniref:Uncharacterized protein n=1 Tax=[Candida] subhashii TaxID=561895 RepID=A0A8J5QFZ7_9ASCO|nr:uncharacterized protein J8A68_005997 [[Candida] subhashii]KAG7660491.1 hypothetical protein J8A68_005997 [[Candida] subhashii]
MLQKSIYIYWNLSKLGYGIDKTHWQEFASSSSHLGLVRFGNALAWCWTRILAWYLTQFGKALAKQTGETSETRPHWDSTW